MYYEIDRNVLPKVRLVDRAVLEPPYIHEARQADEYILYIITKGTLHLRENDKKYVLAEGDVILLDPDFEHSGLKTSCCEYYCIYFKHSQIKLHKENSDFMEKCLRARSELSQKDSDSWLNLPKHISLRKGSAYLKIVQLVREAIEHDRNPVEDYQILCAYCLREVLREIAREAVSEDAIQRMQGIPHSYRRVYELLGYLNTSYQKDISSKIIEEEFCCNFDYLNRVFKKTIGKTIFVYLNEIRIQHAREMLDTTSMKVAAVGYRVGFQDECYFSKVFKKYTGVSPGKYEKLTFQLTEMQQKPMEMVREG